MIVDLKDPNLTHIAFRYNGQIILEASCYLLDSLLHEAQKGPDGKQTLDPGYYLPRWKAHLAKLAVHSGDIPDDWAMAIAHAAVKQVKALGPISDPT